MSEMFCTGYWVIELFESGYHQCAWNRLLIISAEDCWGILTQEIVALLASFDRVNKGNDKGDKPEGWLFPRHLLRYLPL
jgi:hypothetical protein